MGMERRRIADGAGLTVLRKCRGVIVGTAALFAAVHYTPGDANPEQMPLLFLLGAALGYIYERTGSLWASMTLHAMFNGFVLATVSHLSS